MRSPNFHYEVQGIASAFVVHRGVTEGMKRLLPKQRELYWAQRAVPCDGVAVLPGARLSVAPAVLGLLKRKALVIVSNPMRPRVWTAKRIRTKGQRVAGVL